MNQALRQIFVLDGLENYIPAQFEDFLKYILSRKSAFIFDF